jgi:Ankyrin repeats (3 copies)
LSGSELRIWLNKPVEVVELLAPLQWIQIDDCLERNGRHWWAQLVGPRRVFSEDVPSDVATSISDVSWMVEIFCEGNALAAYKAILQAANAIAREGNGVISSDAELWRPRGIRQPRESYLEAEQSDSLLQLAWWAEGGRLDTRAGIAQVFRVIERTLPVALPNRWDIVEPPSQRLSTEGVTGLIDFLDTNRDHHPCLWPRPPVRSLDLNGSWWGGPFEMYVSLYFRILIDANVLDDTRNVVALPQLFKALSQVIRPFYGEARIVHSSVTWNPESSDYSEEGSQHMSWRGVPTAPAIAIAVGAPYSNYWLNVPNGDDASHVSIFTETRWSRQTICDCPPPPESIAKRTGEVFRDRRATWIQPQIWPFDMARSGGLWKREALSPLHQAAQNNHVEELESLLERGYDPNDRDIHGRTPLYWAAHTGSFESAARLISFGATVDMYDDRGNTPLMAGITHIRGRDKVVALLVKSGADPTVSNHLGETPISKARTLGLTNVIPLLEPPETL